MTSTINICNLLTSNSEYGGREGRGGGEGGGGGGGGGMRTQTQYKAHKHHKNNWYCMYETCIFITYYFHNVLVTSIK